MWDGQLYGKIVIYPHLILHHKAKQTYVNKIFIHVLFS